MKRSLSANRVACFLQPGRIAGMNDLLLRFRYSVLVALVFLAGQASAGPAKTIAIGLIGDSTVATTYGWGPAFAARLNGRGRALNFAKNGATLDSLSRKLDELLKEKPDHVLIQFGHNDMKRYDAAAYGEKLRGYIGRVKKAGSRPVVLSSVTRRHFDEQGKIAPRVIEGRTLPKFAKVARRVAKEEGVSFIDLNAISIRHHNRIGPKASAAYNFKEDDRTHFSEKGAEAIADLVIRELKSAAPELAVCLSAPWKGAGLQWESLRTKPTRQLSLQPVAAVNAGPKVRRRP